MLRTNYFQRGADGEPQAVPLVQARPGAGAAGCRCRGRGSRSSSTRRASRACTCAAARSRAAGIRWSDRREDFRTEVLGLMKAQMVKNAVIVPVGAKGGFVVKRPPPATTATALHGGGRGLLPDLHPRAARRDRQHRRRRDRAAAGRRALRRATTRTSWSPPTRAPPTFSDIANGIAREYGFWLGDAFASGGSTRLRPQEDGHHRARRVGVGQAPLPRARARHPERGLHGRRRSATCRATCSATGCCCRSTSGWSARSTTGTSSSTRTRTRRAASRSASGCSSCRARRGPTTTATLISRGRRRVPAHGEVDPALAGGARGARRARRGARAERTDPGAADRGLLGHRLLGFGLLGFGLLGHGFFATAFLAAGAFLAGASTGSASTASLSATSASAQLRVGGGRLGTLALGGPARNASSAPWVKTTSSLTSTS